MDNLTISGMGSHQGWSDKASRSLSDVTTLRERYNTPHAGLRRQRKSEVATLGRWSHKALQDSRLRGFQISRSTWNHRGEM